jgi:hypothetical protein
MKILKIKEHMIRLIAFKNVAKKLRKLKNL